LAPQEIAVHHLFQLTNLYRHYGTIFSLWIAHTKHRLFFFLLKGPPAIF